MFRDLMGKIGEKMQAQRPSNEGPKRSTVAPINQEPAEPAVEPAMELPEVFTPETKEDLIWLIKRMPKTALSDLERRRLAGVMTFSEALVRDIMLPREQVPFVQENEFLGPLTLDKLYKSGLSHFPVTGAAGRVVGVIHTDALNSLEVREMDQATHYLDPKVYYMRDDYTLEQALAAFLRTNCYFFLVIDKNAHVVGMLTYQMVAEYLLGEIAQDEFDKDQDLLAVARREG